MRSRLTFLAILIFLSFSIIAFGQQKTQSKIRKIPVTYTPPSEPAQMYKAYCASCHGMDGKGNGPAAPAMKVPPTDLTQMSKKNGGQFPAARVNSVLSGTAELAAHGSQDMPVWGPVLKTLGTGNGAHEQLRINNLTKYLQSIQAK